MLKEINAMKIFYERVYLLETTKLACKSWNVLDVYGFIMGNTAESILNQFDYFLNAIKPLGLKTPAKLDD